MHREPQHPVRAARRIPLPGLPNPEVAATAAAKSVSQEFKRAGGQEVQEFLVLTNFS